MSLIVTVSTHEGIVMASDSRTSLAKPIVSGEKVVGRQLFELSDTAYKTYQYNKWIGISTCGGAHVSGLSITEHLENLRLQEGNDEIPVEGLCCKLRDYFLGLENCPEIILHVAGYDVVDGRKEQVLRKLVLGGARRLKVKRDLPSLGVSWDGETGVMSRIMKPGYIVGPGNSHRLPLITVSNIVDGVERVEKWEDRIVIPGFAPWHPELEVEWQLFSLQDGIDFATYAIKTTIDTMRFQSVPKTVGGPIDVLVIAPNGSSWVAHKGLHA